MYIDVSQAYVKKQNEEDNAKAANDMFTYSYGMHDID
jgi:hypothetical protein